MRQSIHRRWIGDSDKGVHAHLPVRRTLRSESVSFSQVHVNEVCYRRGVVLLQPQQSMCVLMRLESEQCGMLRVCYFKDVDDFFVLLAFVAFAAVCMRAVLDEKCAMCMFLRAKICDWLAAWYLKTHLTIAKMNRG